MAVTNATSSPSSLQLRLALNCSNYRNSHAILVRARVRKQNRWLRMLCVAKEGARDGNGAERRLNGFTWAGSDSAVDRFSGWSGSDGGEDSLDSQRKKWFGGVVGARVAGAVLVAGLTFAVLSLGRRNKPGSEQLMEPLTTQQDVSLTADDQINSVTEDDNKGSDGKQDDIGPEESTGINKDSSSSSEIVHASEENRVGGDSDIKDFSVDDVKYMSHANDNTSVQEALPHESNFDDQSVDSGLSSKSHNLLESDNGSDLLVASSREELVGVTEELNSELKGNPTSVEPAISSFSDAILSKPCLDCQDEILGSSGDQTSDLLSVSASDPLGHLPNEPLALNVSINLDSDITVEPDSLSKEEIFTMPSSATNETLDTSNITQTTTEGNILPLESHSISKPGSSGTSVSPLASSFPNIKFKKSDSEINRGSSESSNPGTSFSSTGIPAPSVVSAALQVLPGKVVVPAVVDQVQGQALAALQVLKVIEADIQPTDLCTRREYARWLVSASSALSRNTTSKVYPAMYIENVTELAFDDITPEDPDFASIQGLAEAGLISSKLSRSDMISSLDEDQGPFYYSPDSPLSRQDLVSWKIALEKRHLPDADRKVLYQLSGFIDIDKIHLDACPALVADCSSKEQGIVALAFGYTRLFQPDKPVTKAQAAIALATGEASDIVSEELARIEAETIAEKAVAEHNALIAEVEKDVNASFEKELFMEREKIDAIEKMAEEARRELERLRALREEDNVALMKERAAIESEMEVLSRLRHEVEEQLQNLMSNKVEISYEKERVNKLRKEAENKSQEISRLQYELEVERKALSMARTWAEDEAKRAREQAKVLEEARFRWEKHGIKVVVDDDLREESSGGATWLEAGKKLSVEGTVSRAESLMNKLKLMAANVSEKSRHIINKIIEKIAILISNLKEWTSEVGRKIKEGREATIFKVKKSAEDIQRSTSELGLAVKEGAKRVAEDCREGVEKFTQKFKT